MASSEKFAPSYSLYILAEDGTGCIDVDYTAPEMVLSVYRFLSTPEQIEVWEPKPRTDIKTNYVELVARQLIDDTFILRFKNDRNDTLEIKHISPPGVDPIKDARDRFGFIRQRYPIGRKFNLDFGPTSIMRKYY